MPIMVEGPGGEQVEFPDGTAPNVMRDAMRKHFGWKPDAAAAPAPVTVAPSAPAATGIEDIIPSAAESMSGPESGESWHNITNLAQKAAQGLTANYADEIGATAGALPNLITGGRYGRTRQEILDEIRAREKAFTESHPVPAKAAEIGGGLTMAGLTGGLGLGRSPGILRSAGVGATAAGTQAGVAATGAMEGDHTAGEYLENAADNAWLPALMGGGLGGIGGAIGRALTPRVADEARPLLDRDIDLTPGEITGGYGKRLEDIAASVPFFGALVRGRQGESIESFNRAAWEEALAPIRGQGQQARIPPGTDMGREVQQVARRIFNRRYGAVVPRMRAVSDGQFVTDVTAVERTLPARSRADFTDDVQRHVLDNFEPNPANLNPVTGQPIHELTGRALQDSLEGLRKRATALRRNPGNADDFDRADGLDRVRDLLTRLAERSSSPRTVGQFRRLQQAYRNYVVLRDAGSRVGAEQGMFTPAQLHSAVRGADQTVGKGATARGEAALQELSDAAKTVMTRRVADSGTPERAAIIGAVTAPAAAAKAAAAMIPQAALYTRTGSQIFRGLARRPDAAKELLRRRAARLGVTLGTEGEFASRAMSE